MEESVQITPLTIARLRLTPDPGRIGVVKTRPCNRKTFTLAKPKTDDSHKNETFAGLIHAGRLIRWTRSAVYEHVASTTATVFYGLTKDANAEPARGFTRKILFTIVRLTDQPHDAHGINSATRER